MSSNDKYIKVGHVHFLKTAVQGKSIKQLLDAHPDKSVKVLQQLIVDLEAEDKAAKAAKADATKVKQDAKDREKARKEERAKAENSALGKTDK